MLKTSIFCMLCAVYMCSIPAVYSALCTVQEQRLANDEEDTYDYSVNYTYMVCENVHRSNITRLRSYEKRVKYVIFKNSSLTYIPNRVFSRYYNVEMIYLNNSEIVRLEPGAFDGPPKLKKLYLNYNNISEIKTNIFSSLPELTHLDLSYNYLRYVEPNSFAELSKLTKLLLDHNQIEIVNKTMFNSLANLEYLDMSSNILTSANGAFTDLFKLSTLLLNYNYIDKITQEYNSHKFLRTLDLSYNYISEFDASKLPDFLQSINVSNNNVNTLENLTRMIYLKDFDISFNNLTKVSINSIKNMDKLITFQMQNNYLTEVPIGFFSGCVSMAMLNLSRNEITSMEYGLFSGLNSLSTLDISHNEIDVLEADTFYSLPNLETLDISFNKVGFLSLYKLAQHCRNLRTVNLAGNNFTCASLSSIMRDAKIGHFGTRRSIDVLHGNLENVTNIHGIPCRNTNNNNLLYKVISSLPDKNGSALEEFDNFFNFGFKNTTFYRFFADNFMPFNYSENEHNQDEGKTSTISDDILSKLSAIQHLLIIVVLIVIVYTLLQVVRSVLYFRHPRKSSSIEPDFLL